MSLNLISELENNQSTLLDETLTWVETELDKYKKIWIQSCNITIADAHSNINIHRTEYSFGYKIKQQSTHMTVSHPCDPITDRVIATQSFFPEKTEQM